MVWKYCNQSRPGEAEGDITVFTTARPKERDSVRNSERGIERKTDIPDIRPILYRTIPVPVYPKIPSLFTEFKYLHNDFVKDGTKVQALVELDGCTSHQANWFPIHLPFPKSRDNQNQSVLDRMCLVRE